MSSEIVASLLEKERERKRERENERKRERARKKEPGMHPHSEGTQSDSECESCGNVREYVILYLDHGEKEAKRKRESVFIFENCEF